MDIRPTPRPIQRRDYTNTPIRAPIPAHPEPQRAVAVEDKITRRRKKAVLNNVLRLLVLILIVAMIFFGWRLYKRSTVGSTRPAFNVAAGQVNFPLYSPSQLPAGFKWVANSLSAQGTTVNFSIRYGEKQPLIVTEQARPSVIEEVKKTKEFDTNIGKAYIADLNGHITGFIETDKTLIILSSADNPDTDPLQELLTNFKQVQ